MRPSLAPVRNGRGNTHDFPDDEEPEYVPRGAVRRKTSAKPGAKNRNYDKERRAGARGPCRRECGRLRSRRERSDSNGSVQSTRRSRAGNCRLRPRRTLTCIRSPDGRYAGRMDWRRALRFCRRPEFKLLFRLGSIHLTAVDRKRSQPFHPPRKLNKSRSIAAHPECCICDFARNCLPKHSGEGSLCWTMANYMSLSIATEGHNRWLAMQSAYAEYTRASELLECTHQSTDGSTTSERLQLTMLEGKQRVAFERYLESRLEFLECRFDQSIQPGPAPPAEVGYSGAGSRWAFAKPRTLLEILAVILLCTTAFSLVREKQRLRKLETSDNGLQVALDETRAELRVLGQKVDAGSARPDTKHRPRSRENAGVRCLFSRNGR